MLNILNKIKRLTAFIFLELAIRVVLGDGAGDGEGGGVGGGRGGMNWSYGMDS